MTVKQIEASSGSGWARAAVAVGAVLSVAGNATETVLTDSLVNLAIRITIAVALPVLVFIAVEVFVRVAWRRTALDLTGRVMLLVLPAFGAAYVSFGHLYRLARLSGADEIAASANALAIDGLMIGGTVALLAIRAARLAERVSMPDPSLAEKVKDLAEQVGMPLDPWQRNLIEKVYAEPLPTDLAALSTAPRKPRAPKAEQERAVRMLLDGTDRGDVMAATGLSRPTLQRYARVIGMERAGKIDIDLNREKVSPHLYEIIREHVASEVK